MKKLLLLLLLTHAAFGYFEPIVGLTFTEPKGWKTARSEGEQRWEIASTDPAGWGQIALRTTELGETESLSREQILEITRKLAANLQGFALLGTKPVQLGGLPAHLLSYTATSGRIRLQTTQVFAVRAGRLVLLSLTSPPSNHKERRKVFDRVLDSVKWSDPK